MAKEDLQRLTKPQLLRRLSELRKTADEQIKRLHGELEVYREESSVQHEHLLESEQALSQASDRFLALYHGAPIPLLTLDRNGVVEEINDAGVSLLGRNLKQILHRPLIVFVLKEDQPLFLNHVTRCRATDQPQRVEIRLDLRGRPPVLVQLATRAASRPHLGGVCYLTAMTDLTELRAAESERHRLSVQEAAARSASEAKDQFLAVLSHELRTPLTPILAVISSWAAQEDLPEGLRADLAMIRRNLQMETQLIDDLLDLNRITHNKIRFDFRPVDAHGIAQEAVQMIVSSLPGRSLDFRVELNALSCMVWADPARLRQVLWNLLTNAVKFTPDGGAIILRTHDRTPTPGLHLAPNAPDGAMMRGAIEIEVTDTGIGIEPETLPRLFQAFEQASPRSTMLGGLGLGLSICRGLVQAHGGHIRAASPGRGQGATFTIELAALAASSHEPAPARSAIHPPANHRPPSRPGRKLRILLVEDHPDTARIMARLLAAEGYEVQAFSTVHAALNDAADIPDLVISDIGLPDGSGLDLIRVIRGRRAVPAIALSGFGADADIERSRSAGFSEHLTKPVDFPRLLEVIQRVAPH